MAQKNQNRADTVVKISFYLLVFFTALIFIYGTKVLIVPIILSLLNYLLFSSVVEYFENLGINRIYSITMIFIVMLIFVAGLVYVAAPPIITQLKPLLSEWTNTIDEKKFKYLNLSIAIKFNEESFNVNEIIQPMVIIQTIFEYIKTALKDLIAFIPNLITYALITPVISFIFLLSLDKFKKNMIELIPNRFFEMTLMLDYQINRQITNYLKSLAIQAMIMSSIVATGLFSIGFVYPVFLGLTVGLANSIPYLGPLLGSIPVILICLFDPTYSGHLYYVIGIILFAQLVDNILVQPAFIAKSVSLNPIILIGGVVVAGNLFGIMGMLFAVPLMSVIKVSLGLMYTSLKEYKII